MKKTQGFTLIELVIVIVILGLLAATAAPKFIDLSSDAQISSIKSMKGTLSSGASMINMKAIIHKQTEGSGSITEGGVNIILESGYPTGLWQGSMRYIPGLDTVNFSTSNTVVCTVEWCGRGNQSSIDNRITAVSPAVIGKVYPKGFSFNDKCGVYYINNLNGSAPVINIETNDC